MTHTTAGGRGGTGDEPLQPTGRHTELKHIVSMMTASLPGIFLAKNLISK